MLKEGVLRSYGNDAMADILVCAMNLCKKMEYITIFWLRGGCDAL